MDLNQIKKQASFFFKEKIRTARLALTDVTPIQLLTEEATSGNSSAPNAKTMRLISRSAFEIDDYLRIVGILHRRLGKFEKKEWREPYNSLVLLDNLLTHGPERIADEFKINKDTIEAMNKFQYIDEKGFNWGLIVKKKSERVLELLEKGPLFREEREKCRKISREIKGFGSFTQNSKNNSNLNFDKNSNLYGRRSISLYEDYSSKEDQKENFDLKLNKNLNLNENLKLQIEEERIEFTEVKESEPFLAQKEEKTMNEVKKMEEKKKNEFQKMEEKKVNEFQKMEEKKKNEFQKMEEKKVNEFQKMEEKKMNEFQKMDHPFGFEKKNESMLLLSQG